MDKLTIRHEAIKLAVQFRSQPEDAIEVAKKFEEYIIGEADVSEYENPNKILFEMMSKTIKDNDAELKKVEEKLGTIFLQKDGEKVE